jgi:hypothetical protein
MKKTLLLAGGILLVVLLASCQFAAAYSADPLSGTINGTAWTFTDGTIDSTGVVTMKGSVSGYEVLFTVSPLQVGSVKLKLDLFDLASTKTVTLYDGTTNYIIADGNYEILTVTDTQVTGQMNITSDNNSLNGQFTLSKI